MNYSPARLTSAILLLSLIAAMGAIATPINPTAQNPDTVPGMTISDGPETRTEPSAVSPGKTPSKSTATGEAGRTRLGSSAGKTAPTVLFGRIEELTGRSGARFPIRLQVQQPMMDNSQHSSSNLNKQEQQPADTRYGRTQLRRSFPTTWQGLWSGNLKLFSVQFDPRRWRLDPAEATREAALMRPGNSGQVTFRFTSNRAGEVYLEPAQVVFWMSARNSTLADAVNQMFGPESRSDSKAMTEEMLSRIPVAYSLHLGDLQAGMGVTGNTLDSRLVKNDVHQLVPGVLEQQVITHDRVANPKSGQIRFGYTESVLRFTRQSADQLYVQAASVSYYQDGQFEGKYVLYGTVHRLQQHPGREVRAVPGWPFSF